MIVANETSKPASVHIGQKNSNSGFTLIEVLVTALILSVGLLGIVTLQARALQYNQQAYLYSQATFLVNDIAERMRSNVNKADQYQIDFADVIIGVAADRCITSSCTEDEVVDWDLKLWKDSLARALPQGDGAIKKDGDQFVITAQFDDSRGENSLTSVVKITVEL